MKRLIYIPVLVTCLAVLTVAQVSPVEAGDKGLDGVYELIRLDTPNGPQTTQKGMLIAKDGYLCHIRVAKTREAPTREDSDEVRVKKAAELFQSSNGTCGSYTIEGNKVVTKWHTALAPNVEGNESEFIWERSGDTLKIAPAAAPTFQFVYEAK